MSDETHPLGAGLDLFAAAVSSTKPTRLVPQRARRHFTGESQAPFAAGADFDPANRQAKPKSALPDHGGGQKSNDTQISGAASAPSASATVRASPKDKPPKRGENQYISEAHLSPVLPTLIETWRQRQDLRRAIQRLDLQCQAVCRRYCDGDREKAKELWTALKKGEGDPSILAMLKPLIGAIDMIDKDASEIEKQCAKLVKQHPLWAWAECVRGIGAESLAGILAEAGDEIADYRTVSGLWKRFGLAVINGERQRRKTDVLEAELHGYSPQRRSYMYVIATNLMRAQREVDPYRAIYDKRKEYELARSTEEKPITKAHAHNRALRVMVKELLKDMWAAARKLKAA